MKKILGLLLFLTVGFSQAPVTTANLSYYIGELYFNRTHLDSLLPADSSSIYIEGYTAMDSTGIDGLGFVPDLEFTEFKDAIDDSISANVDSTFIDNLNFIPDLQLANVTNVATSDAVYDATNWDGNTDNATKNAIRDKIETLPGGHDPVTLNANATAAGLSLSTQEINYRAATNSQTGYMTVALVQNIETNNAKATDTVPDSSDIDALNFVPDLELTDYLLKSAVDDSISVNVDSSFVDNLNFIPDLELTNYLLKAADRDSNTVHLAFAVTGNTETGITVTAPGDGTLDFVVTGAPPTFAIRDGGTPITGNPSDLDFLGTDFVLSDVAKSDSVEISIADSGIDHDQTTNFVTAKHYDWTQDLGATNIHSGNYTDTNTQLDSSGVDALNFVPDLELTDYTLLSVLQDTFDVHIVGFTEDSDTSSWLATKTWVDANDADTQLDSSGVDALNFVPDLELTDYTLLSVLQDTFDVHIVGFTEDSDTTSWLATATDISDLNIGNYLLKTAVSDSITDNVDSTFVDNLNFVPDLEFGDHTGTDHLFESELDDFSELQNQISDKTLVNEEDDFTITGLYVFSDSAYIDTLQFGIIYGGTIKTGTWNGTAISDSYIDNNITITNLSGTNTGDNDIMEGGVSVSTAPNYLDFLGADFNLSDGATVDSVTIVINDGGINHDNTANYSANKHIDHTGVDFTAGDGLRGGGTIASNRTFIVNLDFDGGLETTDDSINVKLDGSTLAKGTSGLKVNSITVSLISDFDAEVASNSAVAANTEKVTDDDIGVAEVYHITNWNADTGSPQKNDLRDYFALFDTDGDGDIDNYDVTNLTNAVSSFTLTALQVDNLNLNGNTISSTAGTDLIITPLAGQDIILDNHWQFDGADLTALTNNNTIINAYSGKNITIESVAFDGGKAGFGTSNPDNLITLGSTLLGAASGNAVSIQHSNYAQIQLGYNSTNRTVLNWNADGSVNGFFSIGTVTTSGGSNWDTFTILDGNIGIGETVPSAKLEVNADVIAGTATVAGFYHDQSSSGGARIILGFRDISPEVNARITATQNAGSTYGSQFHIETHKVSATADDWNTILYGNASGNVGIGTTNPDEKFEVEWSANVDVEIGVGTSDTDITFIKLRSPNGTPYWLYPADGGGSITISATKP